MALDGRVQQTSRADGTVMSHALTIFSNFLNWNQSSCFQQTVFIDIETTFVCKHCLYT